MEVTRRWIEECYDGLNKFEGGRMGAGQERSKKLKWKVNRRQEGLGSFG